MNARYVFVAIAAISLSGRHGECQVAMGIQMDHVSYLENERIVAHVVVSNMGAEALVIGGLRQAATIEFDVRRKNERIPRISGGLVVQNAMIMPGECNQITVDLDDHYVISAPGQYSVTAELKTERETYVSQQKAIDVVPGIVVAKSERFAPDAPDKHIDLSLRRWTRKGGNRLFFVALNREDKLSLGVFDLGAMVQVEKPRLAADADGTVTVEHYADTGVQVRTVFLVTSRGAIFIRQDIRKPEAASRNAGKSPLPAAVQDKTGKTK